jgi:hypothetical protein
MWIPITERARYRTLLWKIEMAVRASLQRRGPTSSILAALLWIDFVAFAKACGAEGFRCEKPDEVRGAIQAALNSPGVAIVEAVVDAEEKPPSPTSFGPERLRPDVPQSLRQKRPTSVARSRAPAGSSPC